MKEAAKKIEGNSREEVESNRKGEWKREQGGDVGRVEEGGGRGRVEEGGWKREGGRGRVEEGGWKREGGRGRVEEGG